MVLIVTNSPSHDQHVMVLVTSSVSHGQHVMVLVTSSVSHEQLVTVLVAPGLVSHEQYVTVLFVTSSVQVLAVSFKIDRISDILALTREKQRLMLYMRSANMQQ